MVYNCVLCVLTIFVPINVTEYSLREADEVSHDNSQAVVKGTAVYNPLTMTDLKPWQGKSISVEFMFSFINPRCACASRVTVLGLWVCICVCMCVCVHSNLPRHTLESQKSGTNGFIAIQERLKGRFS